MRARIIIEYEPEWTEVALEHLGWQRLQNQEKQAWMTGTIRVPSLRSATVKFELLDKPSIAEGVMSLPPGSHGSDVEGATLRQHFANYVVSTPLIGLCDTAFRV